MLRVSVPNQRSATFTYKCPCDSIVEEGDVLHVCSICGDWLCKGCFDYDSKGEPGIYICEECVSISKIVRPEKLHNRSETIQGGE